MRGALLVARHDLRMILADRSALLWLFVLPVVFATFFGLVMGGGGGGPSTARAQVVIDDRDGGSVARLLLEELASERLAVLPLADLGEAEAVRTLVLPEGLSARVLAGEQVTLRLVTAPDASAEATLLVQARVTAAAARVIARLVLAAPSDGGPVDAGRLAAVELPADAVVVDSRFAGRARPVPGGFAHSVPANVTMFVLLVSLTWGAASWSAERQAGLVRRLATTPLSPRAIVGGKLIGRAAAGLIQVALLVTFAAVAEAFLDLGLEGHLTGMLAVLSMFALAVAPLGVLLGGWFTDPDRAASVGVIATLVMAALGGCWWPLEVVSEPLQKLALLLPTGWAMTALHGVVSFGRDLAGVATALLVLAGFGVAGALAAGRALRL